MSGFIEGEDRNQATLFPERLDDYVAEDSQVRVIDVFIDDLDGLDTLLNEDPVAGQYRNEPARARLQLEAGHQPDRNSPVDSSDRGIRSFAHRK